MSEHQTELGFPVSILEQQEDKGRWPDLTRLEAKRPDILGAIVYFLARAVSVRSICKALRVSPCTVNRVRHDPRWKEAVVSESKGVVAKIDEILALSVEDILEQAREGKLPTVFDLKLLFDIRQLLSGGATQRVELRASEEEEEFMRFISQAKALPASGMVFEAETLPQSAAARPVRDVTPARPVETGDSESLASAS